MNLIEKFQTDQTINAINQQIKETEANRHYIASLLTDQIKKNEMLAEVVRQKIDSLQKELLLYDNQQKSINEQQSFLKKIQEQIEKQHNSILQSFQKTYELEMLLETQETDDCIYCPEVEDPEDKEQNWELIESDPIVPPYEIFDVQLKTPEHLEPRIDMGEYIYHLIDYCPECGKPYYLLTQGQIERLKLFSDQEPLNQASNILYTKGYDKDKFICSNCQHEIQIMSESTGYICLMSVIPQDLMDEVKKLQTLKDNPFVSNISPLEGMTTEIVQEIILNAQQEIDNQIEQTEGENEK